MSINFSTLQGLTIPEGVVTQITDASGRVLWAVQSGDKVILQVEKITSDTYAGETTYTGEQFVLLDIYPKTNGTVKVTYGGLTKTITDTSGAAEPNAQQVFFGTFNGVADSVATPASGELTIEGDYRGFGQAIWKRSSKDVAVGAPVPCITNAHSLGNISFIPQVAFKGCIELTSIIIPKSVTIIVAEVGLQPFMGCDNLVDIQVEIGNDYFSVENGALLDKNKTKLIRCSAAIGHYTVPISVTRISIDPFGKNTTSITLLATTPPEISSTTFGGAAVTPIQTITVPKGCGEIYKAAKGWENYADLIVEAE